MKLDSIWTDEYSTLLPYTFYHTAFSKPEHLSPLLHKWSILFFYFFKRRFIYSEKNCHWLECNISSVEKWTEFASCRSKNFRRGKIRERRLILVIFNLTTRVHAIRNQLRKSIPWGKWNKENSSIRHYPCFDVNCRRSGPRPEINVGKSLLYPQDPKRLCTHYNEFRQRNPLVLRSR